ncbi:MAG: cupin-like domain-containing protein [Burkholderiaceae bacterium]
MAESALPFKAFDFPDVARVPMLSAERFLREFKANARPVIIEQMTTGWPARERWSLGYLRRVAGAAEVPVYDSVRSRDHKHQHAPAARMPLSAYLDRVEAGESDLRLFFYNVLSGAPQLMADFSFPDLGLRLFRKLPVLFIGGRGARVQMHFDIDWADLLLSHFGGRKRVLLFPPDQARALYHVPFSFSSLGDIDYDAPDFDRFPALRKARGCYAMLAHGETLYIPPGWWHYIVYEDIGFSLTLRAFPRRLPEAAVMVRNLAVTRVIEGVMRALIGQAWNDRNERLAVRRSHRALGLGQQGAG